MQSGSLSALLRERSLGSVHGSAFQHTVGRTASTWESVRMTDNLLHHSGCVNHVSFSEAGDLLLSGSDDTRVGVWRWDAEDKMRMFLHTGHLQNIFCVRFMPGTDDKVIASCSGDGTIRVMDVNSGKNDVYRRHQDRVKKFVTEPGNPNTLVSCGEDGLVYEFDRRQPASQARLLAILWDNVSIKAEANSICSPARKPWLLAVGGSDGRVRVYDRRMYAGADQRDLNFKEALLANVLVKPNVQESAWPGNPITGIDFTADGRHIAANILNDCVYLLDVDDMPRHSARQEAEREVHKQQCRRRRRRRRESSAADEGDGCPTPAEALAQMEAHNSGEWWRASYRSGAEASTQPANLLPPSLAELSPATKCTLAELMANASLERGSIFSPGELQAAAKYARAAVSLAPRMGRTHYSVAMAAYLMGEHGEALLSVDTALRYSWSEELDALREDICRRMAEALRNHVSAASASACTHADAQQDNARPDPQATSTDAIAIDHDPYTVPPAEVRSAIAQHRRMLTAADSEDRLHENLWQGTFDVPNSTSFPAPQESSHMHQQQSAALQGSHTAGSAEATQRSTPPAASAPAVHEPMPMTDSAQPSSRAVATNAHRHAASTDVNCLPPVTGSHPRHDSATAQRQSAQQPDEAARPNAESAHLLADSALATPPMQLGDEARAAASPADHIRQQGSSDEALQYLLLLDESLQVTHNADPSPLGVAHVGRPDADVSQAAATASAPESDALDSFLEIERRRARVMEWQQQRRARVDEALGHGSDWDDDDDGNDYEEMSGQESEDIEESEASWEEVDPLDAFMAVHNLQESINYDWADGFGPLTSSGSGHKAEESPLGVAGLSDWRLQGFAADNPHACTSPDEQPRCWSMRYGGHQNRETVKDVSFVGPHDEVVAAGSDGGYMYLWDRVSGRLLAAVRGDGTVVNCVAGHPHVPVLASCGIDDSVKLWAPQYTGRSHDAHMQQLLSAIGDVESDALNPL